MASYVARRGFLQAGALTGGIALTGLRPSPAMAAAPAENTPPLTGVIGGHIRLDLARGAVIRTAQLDQTLRLVRELGEVRMPLAHLYDGARPAASGTPLQRACARAQALATEIVAADWRVPSRQLVIDRRGIVHPPSGRTIGYKAWVDVV